MSEDFEAGPEMDALIAEKVMGWRCLSPHPAFGQPWPKETDWYNEYGEHCWRTNGELHSAPWMPSTDIAAAWMVVEKLFSEALTDIEIKAQSRLVFYVTIYRPSEQYEGAASSAPLAICRAALKAVGA